MDPVLIEAHQRIQSALEHLKVELSSIRAGRANPSLIENVPVSAYGGTMKLLEVGTISAPQPNLLTVQVWDASIIRDVEKSILESNLGISPAVDGTTIRLPLPLLTEERRNEYAKLAGQKGEASKVEMRHIRQEYREKWEQEEKMGTIGEDELQRREKILQGLIDKCVSTADEYVKAKQEELRQL